jgi:hypothetical protein
MVNIDHIALPSLWDVGNTIEQYCSVFLWGMGILAAHKGVGPAKLLSIGGMGAGVTVKKRLI